MQLLRISRPNHVASHHNDYPLQQTVRTRSQRPSGRTHPPHVSRAQSISKPNWDYLPNLSREAVDVFLPITNVLTTGLQQLGDSHWCLRQDFWATENVFLNTHIIGLRNGSLMMVGPPACTEEARALVNSIPGGGERIQHVVSQSLVPEHWFYNAQWAPYVSKSATLWVPPGLMEQQGMVGPTGGGAKLQAMKAAYTSICVLPESGGPFPGLEDEVEVATLREATGIFTECSLLLRDYRAAVFADAAFAAIEQPLTPMPWSQAGRTVTGIYKKLGCPFVYGPIQLNPQLARPYVEQVLSWDVDFVFAAHLDPVVPNAREELRQCFDFMREPQPAARA